LIEIRDTELKAVQNTVQTEMRSYSSVVAKSCSAALAPKKIKAAVRKVIDKDDRSRNVIIYGLEKTGDEKLNNKVETVLKALSDLTRLLASRCELDLGEVVAIRM
jgi:hypothetical protein